MNFKKKHISGELGWMDRGSLRAHLTSAPQRPLNLHGSDSARTLGGLMECHRTPGMEPQEMQKDLSPQAATSALLWLGQGTWCAVNRLATLLLEKTWKWLLPYGWCGRLG